MNQHSIILLLALVIVILAIYLSVKHSGENYRLSIWDTVCDDVQISKCQSEGWTSSPQCEFCDNA
jgi:hypothetical protein